MREGFNSLPDDNFFLDNKIVVDQIMGYISSRVEKHYRKRRQSFFQAFSPLPTIFSKAFFLNHLPDMTILDFSNLAGNTDIGPCL